MAQTIKLKRSASQGAIPSISDLDLGEVAINTYDGKMYLKKDDGTSPQTIVEISGAGGVAGGDFTFLDNEKAIFGTGSDLEIYSDGTDSYITEGTAGNLLIQGATLKLQTGNGLKDYLVASPSAEVTLYYDNAAKLATAATGIDVTGTVTADGATIDGTLELNSNSFKHTALTPSHNLIESDITGENTQFLQASGTLRIRTVDDSVLNPVERLRIDHGTGDISFYEDTGTNVKFFWDASAESLGIGTSSPGRLLELRESSTGAGDAIIRLRGHGNNADNTSLGSLEWFNADSSGAQPGVVAAVEAQSANANGHMGKLLLKTHDGSGSEAGPPTTRMTIDQSGNVGIGTSSPGEALEVVGKVEADEFLGPLRGAILFNAQADEALVAGDVVYISGISGNTTTVAKADADDAAKMPAFGLALAAANLNAAVEIVTFGSLSNIDTSTFSEGDELFVSTTAGGLVNSAPTGESAQIQKVAKVTRSDASIGSVKVLGAGRSNATPNLNTGRLFVGDANNQTVTDDTIYVDIANSRVGVGTASPDTALEVSGVKNTSELRLSSTTNDALWSVDEYYGKLSFYSSDQSGAGVGIKGSIVTANSGGSSGGTPHMAFSVASTTANEVEAMRIDSSGNLLVGKTSTGAATAGIELNGINDLLRIARDGGALQELNRIGTGGTENGDLIEFRVNNAAVGSIGADVGYLTIGKGDTGLLFQDGGDAIQPRSISGLANRDAAIDLGVAGGRFKDLYLSGTANTGTISSGDITTTGVLYGPSTFYIDPSPDDTSSPGGSVTDTGTVVILGDLQVTGTTTTIDSTTLQVSDLNITVAKEATNAAEANGAGLTVAGANATLTYGSTADAWSFNKDLDVVGNVTADGLTVGDSSSAFSLAVIQSSTSGESELRMGDTDTDAGSISYTNTDDTMTFRAAAAARMSLNSTGLDVTGTVAADGSAAIEGTSPKIFLNETDTTDVNTRIRNAFGNLQIQSVDDSDGSPVTRLGIDHSTGDISFYNSAATSQSLYWEASTERLGIGNTSPTSTLDLTKGTDTAERAIRIQNDTVVLLTGVEGSAGNRFVGSAVGNAFFGTSSAHGLELGTNNNVRAVIDSAGNVGINQADPQTKTHITAAGSGSGVTDVLTIQTTRSDVGTAFAGGAINFVNNDTNSAGQARIKVGSSNNAATIGLNSESAQSFIFETSTSGNATTSNIDGNATTITVTHETYAGFVPGQRIAINTGTYQGGYFIDTVTSDTEFTIADTDHDLAADSSGTPTIQYAVPRDSMIIRADGNVGIGTNSPESSLHVSDAVTHAASTEVARIENTTTGEPAALAFTSIADNGGTGNEGAIYFDAGADGTAADNQLQFNADHQTNTTPDMVITGEGNVGIGTSNPSNLLSLKSGTNTDIEFGSETDGGFIQTYNRTSSAYGYLRFITTAGSETMRLDTSGNVGIGISSPLGQLHINTESAEATKVYVDGEVNQQKSIEIRHYDASEASGAGRNLFYLKTPASDRLDIGNFTDGTTETQLMTFLESGNVGIGTSSPSVALDVNGETNTQLRLTASDSLGASIVNFGDQANAAVGRIIYSHIDDSFSFKTNNVNDRLVIDASGNVGIGTSSPTSPLTVTKDAGGVATFTGISSGGVSSVLMKQSRGSIASPSNSSTAGDGNYILGQVYNSGYATIGSIGIITGSALNNGEIQFNTASSGTVAERMRIDAGGNVGIGVTPATDWNTGYKALQLGTTATFMGAASGEGNWISNNAIFSTSGNWEYLQTAAASSLDMQASTAPFRFRYAASGTAGTAISWSEAMRIDSSGNVGIGTGATINYKLEVDGSFAATSKSFDIEHPTKPNHRLRYGSLEGPEHGVYVRGRLSGTEIELPEYWTALVDPDSITVSLTPIGPGSAWVEKIENNKITTGGSENCFYHVFAERVDIEKLVVEYENGDSI